MAEKSIQNKSVNRRAKQSFPDAKGGLYAKAAKHPLVTGGIVLAGAGLAYAAAKAKSKPDENPNIARDVHIETSVTINRSPAELYAFWRKFSNLPLFMKTLESVTELTPRLSHWVAKTTTGIKLEWDAEIFNEGEEEFISWRSVDGADIVHAGTVRFEKAPGDRRSYVRVTMNYNPPAGQVGSLLAKLSGSDPTRLIKEDLRRFKQLMEAGEIASVDGQSSGR